MVIDYFVFAQYLRRVVWPPKFKPGPIEKNDGTTNPKEWIKICSMIIEVASGDDYAKANFVPTVIQGSTQSWLMNLLEGTVQS